MLDRRDDDPRTAGAGISASVLASAAAAGEDDLGGIDTDSAATSPPRLLDGATRGAAAAMDRGWVAAERNASRPPPSPRAHGRRRVVVEVS